MSETILVGKYTALITSEHQDKPNFLASVIASVQPFVDEQNTLLGIPQLYDLDVAVGAQLDTDGEWIGQSREIETPLSGVYFAWGTAGVGWGQGVWKGPFDPSEGLVSLDDTSYRFLLRAKVIANSWDGTIASAAAAFAILFNESDTPGTSVVIQDGMNMTMQFALVGTWPPATFQAIFATGLIPLRPSGVLATYGITSVNGAPGFAWGVQNSLLAGWGTGAWVEPIPV